MKFLCVFCFSEYKVLILSSRSTSLFLLLLHKFCMSLHLILNTWSASFREKNWENLMNISGPFIATSFHFIYCKTCCLVHNSSWLSCFLFNKRYYHNSYQIPFFVPVCDFTLNSVLTDTTIYAYFLLNNICVIYLYLYFSFLHCCSMLCFLKMA